MKAFLEKYREILLYLLFGVLTTAVSFATYFLIFHGGVSLFGASYEWHVRAAAQVLQWVAGVLFAFDCACQLNGTAVKQELFSQGGFTGVRVGDDREGTPFFDFIS